MILISIIKNYFYSNSSKTKGEIQWLQSALNCVQDVEGASIYALFAHFLLTKMIRPQSMKSVMTVKFVSGHVR